MRSNEDERGISFRQLVVAFLAVVALCAVFFSLGFFVGYKERTSSAAPATENVSPPAEVPPVVNPPAVGAEAATSAVSAAPAESSPGPAVTESDMPNPPGTPARPSGSNGASGSSRNAPPAAALARPAPTKGITVQVAALSNRPDAVSLINVLKARGYAPFLISPEEAHADDTLFRVVVGPFASASEAGKARDQLAQDGFKPFIRK